MALDPVADSRVNRGTWLQFNIMYFQCIRANYKRLLVNGFVLLSLEVQ